MVRWKPLAMSDHKCAVGYNFSQPTCPEKKTAQAIPRPMPTYPGAGLRAGAPGNTLWNFTTNVNLQTWQEQQWHSVRAWSPMQKLVCLCCGLCLWAPSRGNFSSREDSGCDGRPSKPCSDALVSTQAPTSTASFLALHGCGHEIPRQNSTKPRRVEYHSGLIKRDLPSIY